MSINVSFTVNTSSSYYTPVVNNTLYNVFNIDGSLYNSPVSLSWVIGSTHSVSAINDTQIATGVLWNWEAWSNGGTQVQSIVAPAVNTAYVASYTIDPQIYGDFDPLTFVVSKYSGTIIDDQGNPVPLASRFPDAINQLPIVTLNPGSAEPEWLTIGAYRLRYRQNLEFTIWAFTPAQRFAIENSIRKQTTLINKNQLAINYVFMWHPSNSYPDEVTLFGTAVFRTSLVLRLIYDILRPT